MIHNTSFLNPINLNWIDEIIAAKILKHKKVMTKKFSIVTKESFGIKIPKRQADARNYTNQSLNETHIAIL